MFKESDVKIGTEIMCTIDEYLVTSAKIQIENNRVFICQDVIEGDLCRNKLGYRHSWSVADMERLREMNTNDFFEITNVTYVKLKIQPEWDSKKNGE